MLTRLIGDPVSAPGIAGTCRGIARVALGSLAIALVAVGCVVEPTGDAVPPSVEIATADARALRYGASALEILAHPQLRERVPVLYGADWDPAPGGSPTALRRPVTDFFARTDALRLLRVGDRLYIAAFGCSAAGCAGPRGLLLVSEDGTELRSRLDEGGLVHYYVHGPGSGAMPPARAILDAAWWVMRSAA